MVDPTIALRSIKIVHTVVWALFAGSIVAIPVLVWLEHWRVAAVLIALVLVECAVLVVNGMRCPLTAVAGRYTQDRRDNFDIYLPLWLARRNKEIFGSLFVAGLLLAIIRWVTA
jgi:hypothetical protein